MTIEATLESIDTSLKAILASLRSGAQIAAAGTEAAEAAEATEATEKPARGRRSTKEKAAQGETPQATTTYYVSESLKQAYARTLGMLEPEDASFVLVSAEQYAAKKAEFTQYHAEHSTGTNRAEAAKAGAEAAAAGAQSSEHEPTWDEAVAALKDLAQNPAHGSSAVMEIIKAIDPGAANVPALKDKGRNKDIVDAVRTRLNPSAADPLFG